MLYKFFRFFLFRLDPEIVHEVLLFLLSLAPVRWILWLCFRFSWHYDDPKLEKNLGGLRFKNPVGLAAGFDKNAKALLGFQALGFGFIEVGTVTPRPQMGNPKPRIVRFEKEEALVNWLGFNNDGIAQVVERLKSVKSKMKIPVGLNIGKNSDTPLEKATDDYVICIERANPVVDFFVINISSPNTPELRRLAEPRFLEELLSRVQRVSHHPVWVKLSPDISQDQLPQIIALCEKYKVSALVATNTTIDYSLLPAAHLSQGGISGNPLRLKSTHLLKALKSQLSSNVGKVGQMALVGVGGILSAQDAQEKISAGVDLIELYTGLIFEGPGLIKKIKRTLL
ncbi:MAG: quinone-dependent dihydroorotate dehydrogenase [Deltaproteobacteria bacterium]|nr:quinone-dependent dihydroorotate dehydrogenase [Deltaproteobacteria bacterium]